MKYANYMTGMCLAIGLGAFAPVANADVLDDIVADGELRCGVMLDAPPVGLRNANNEPIGFDVAVCMDMAEALGVKANVIETPSPDRIPALLSKRVDISISSAGNSLERAKSISFSIPYQIWDQSIAVAADSTDMASFDDLEGKKIGMLRGTTGEAAFLKQLEKLDWSGDTEIISYGSNAEQFLALSQGKVDAIIEGTAIIAEFARGPGEGRIRIASRWETGPIDYTGLMVRREDVGLLNWTNLFVWHQIKNGRIDELYREWFGVPAPDMSLPGSGTY
jgi:polar amino acid transport system substrate-binding protein|tara:strand:+ start:1678 stop:2511 length:834 start_codon:yes stop_codon:yes gene_type:complete